MPRTGCRGAGAFRTVDPKLEDGSAKTPVSKLVEGEIRGQRILTPECAVPTRPSPARILARTEGWLIRHPRAAPSAKFANSNRTAAQSPMQQPGQKRPASKSDNC